MTSHLITTSDGKKMGKSQYGAVWLDADLLSPMNFGSGEMPQMLMWEGFGNFIQNFH